MALPIKPNNPEIPIPNNPFSAPLNPYLQGPYFPFVAGPGVDFSTPGIPTITNDVAAVLSAGSGISLNTVGGITTIATTGGGGLGTVTSVTAGTGLTGGTITTSGTIALANTAVSAGAYTYGSFTVDAQGRLTAASSGTAPVTAVTGTVPVSVTSGLTPVVSIAAASTTASGAVQLYNNTDSNSTTLALTAAQGKNLQEQITALAVTSNITLGGTYDANTGLVSSVTTQGTTAGLVVGSALPAPGVLNNEIFVIVDVQGTNGPNSPTLAHVGDWYLSNGTTWQFLNVGNQPAAATTTTAGVVCLSTDALAQAGTDATTALTPAAGASAYVAKSALTAKGAILGASAACTPSALAVGSDGQMLVACASTTTGLCWVAQPAAAIPCSLLSAKGTLITTSTPTTPVALAVGTDGQILYANSACATGLEWGVRPITCQDFDAKGDLLVGTADNAFTALGVGADTFVLTADAACASGVKWAAGGGGGIPCSCITAKGALITGTAASTPTTLTVGTDGQALLACSTATNGICWGSVSADKACPGTLGTVYGYVGGNVKTDSSTGIGLCSMLSSTPINTPTNSALGFATLCSLTNGGGNVAVGNSALRSMATGNGNIAVGFAAGQAAAGDNNVLVGGSSGSLVAGNQNAFFGLSSGITQTSGDSNVAIGPNTTLASTTGSCQLAIGFSATDNWLTGDSTKAIKPGAGIIDCAASTGTAGQVLMSNGTNAICWGAAGGGGGGTVTSITAGTGLTGGTITASGTIALDTACVIQPSAFLAKGDLLSASASATPLALTVGTNGQVLAANSACVSGLEWVASGIPCSCITAKGALITGTAASTPTTLAVGANGCVLVACSTAINGICWGAPPTATPTVAGTVLGFIGVLNCNTGLGPNALLSVGFVGGTVNTAVGTNALCSLTSGNSNTAVGVNALCTTATSNANSAFGWGSMRSNTNGTNNAAIGINSMLCSTSGSDNLAAGAGALVNNSSGGRNTAVGNCALAANTTGSGNVMVGGMNSAGTYAPVFNPTTENNRVMIGSTATTNAYVQVAWTVTSDARDKTNVTALPVGLDFVNQLNPVAFQFKESRECDTATGPVRYGFLAQEVLAAEGENPVIVDTEVPEYLKVTNDHFNAVLVKAIQELSAKVEALEAKLASNG